MSSRRAADNWQMMMSVSHQSSSHGIPLSLLWWKLIAQLSGNEVYAKYEYQFHSIFKFFYPQRPDSASKKLIESHRDSLRKGSSSSSSIQSQAVNVSSQLNGNLVNLQLFPIKRAQKTSKGIESFSYLSGFYIHRTPAEWDMGWLCIEPREKRSKARKTTPIRSLLPTHTKRSMEFRNFLSFFINEPLRPRRAAAWARFSSPLINNLFLLSCFKHNNFFFTFSLPLFFLCCQCATTCSTLNFLFMIIITGDRSRGEREERNEKLFFFTSALEKKEVEMNNEFEILSALWS